MGLLKWLFGGKEKNTFTLDAKRSNRHLEPTPASPPVASRPSGGNPAKLFAEAIARAAERSHRNAIEHLAHAPWHAYDACTETYIVEPSMPILFFGDGAAYRKSERRVITVGKNPSPEEFPDDPFERFPKMRELIGTSRNSEFYNLYLLSLHGYFQERPYKRWFAGCEALLNGFGCSFYTGSSNTGLHTDLCSPLATSPPWTGLKPEQQDDLANLGVPLWHGLVQHLRPQVILMSFGRTPLKAEARFRWRLDHDLHAESAGGTAVRFPPPQDSPRKRRGAHHFWTGRSAAVWHGVSSRPYEVGSGTQQAPLG